MLSLIKEKLAALGALVREIFGSISSIGELFSRLIELILSPFARIGQWTRRRASTVQDVAKDRKGLKSFFLLVKDAIFRRGRHALVRSWSGMAAVVVSSIIVLLAAAFYLYPGMLTGKPSNGEGKRLAPSELLTPLRPRNGMNSKLFERIELALSPTASLQPTASVTPTVSSTLPTAAISPTGSVDRLVNNTEILKGKIVVLDPGHGDGNNVGAIGPGGTKELDIVLDIANKLKALLENAGARVEMTRTGPTTSMSNTQRGGLATQLQANLFLRIHTDTDKEGTATYWFREDSLKPAQIIHKEMLAVTKLKDSGLTNVRQEGFVAAKLPGVKVVPAHLSTVQEENMLKLPLFRQQVAEALYKGIRQYLLEVGSSTSTTAYSE